MVPRELRRLTQIRNAYLNKLSEKFSSLFCNPFLLALRKEWFVALFSKFPIPVLFETSTINKKGTFRKKLFRRMFRGVNQTAWTDRGLFKQVHIFVEENEKNDVRIFQLLHTFSFFFFFLHFLITFCKFFTNARTFVMLQRDKLNHATNSETTIPLLFIHILHHCSNFQLDSISFLFCFSFLFFFCFSAGSFYSRGATERN